MVEIYKLLDPVRFYFLNIHIDFGITFNKWCFWQCLKNLKKSQHAHKALTISDLVLMIITISL